MTEAEWLSCIEPALMIRQSRSRLRHRKLRLFAVACCRLIWHSIPDHRSRNAVEVAERYADGLATDVELERARQAAIPVHEQSFRQTGKRGACPSRAAVYVANRFAIQAAENISWMTATANNPGGTTSASYPTQSATLREILGNPFRQITVEFSWLTPTVVSLAQAIYDERAFDRLPILADALEDAGCDNADMLNHCRQPGEHVRGCWCVDLVLGKE